jgi:putative redox protein
MSLTLSWRGGLCFEAASDATTTLLDSDGRQGLSPMQAVAAGLGACMAMDVVHILTKARQTPEAFMVTLVAHRADVTPARFERFQLHFTITGHASTEQVERAISLSRDRYCSVWHSLRPDIALETSFEIVPPPG